MNIESFDLAKYNEILSRGLCFGLGSPNGQMCIEAAVCSALDLPHGDDPQCVAESVRYFKIALNDNAWSSPTARAAGLRDLGIAQLGSLGVVDDLEFTSLLAIRTVNTLLPQLFSEVLPGFNTGVLESAATLDAAANAAANAKDAARDATLDAARDATLDALDAAASAASAAKDAAADAKDAAANAVSAIQVGWAVKRAAMAAEQASRHTGDKYLLVAAKIALDILKELHSPGCALLG